MDDILVTLGRIFLIVVVLCVLVFLVGTLTFAGIAGYTYYFTGPCAFRGGTNDYLTGLKGYQEATNPGIYCYNGTRISIDRNH